jgi:YD repeat-containing protein
VILLAERESIYDARYHLERLIEPERETVSYTSDNNGNRLSRNNNRGQTTVFLATLLQHSDPKLTIVNGYQKAQKYQRISGHP